MGKLKALVVDDSAVFRKIIGDVLGGMQDVEVVGTARNGRVAIERISELMPDLVTLDLEMPEMDGLATLMEIKRRGWLVDAVMVSAHTTQGAAITMKALEEGACDFIAKPVGLDMADSMRSLSTQLASVVATVAAKRRRGGSPAAAPAASRGAASSDPEDVIRRMRLLASSVRRDVVAIGISTGGPNALVSVVPRLPSTLRVPVLIVQHMPPLFTAALADSLAKRSSVAVVEGCDGMELRPATVYIAPGGKQMRVEKTNGVARVQITDAPPENNCRPSADYLFRSVAQAYRSAALGVIMTGMGGDGAKGLREMRAQGAKVFAQDEATCTIFGMPKEAIQAGVVDVVLPLDAIANAIVAAVK